MDLSIEKAFDRIKTFIKDPSQDYTKTCFNNHICIPYFMSFSPKVPLLSEPLCGEINLIMQFYIDKDIERQKEIRQTLFLNVNNKSIDKIYLINEREYTEEELGCKSDKIVQFVSGSRMTFEYIFDFIETNQVNGYIVIANSDIFFDKSLQNLKLCDFSKKTMLALCRYEYDGVSSLRDCKLFESGRPDSQDTWMFHSDINIAKRFRHLFNFSLGKPGCDNKLIYLMQIIGYQCYNEVTLLKTYHNHHTNVRHYAPMDKIPLPYCCIYPRINEDDIPSQNQSFNMLIENENLCEYVKKKMIDGNNFVIPRVAGIENEMAYTAIIRKQANSTFSLKDIERPLYIMKNNAGIKLSSFESIDFYSKLYLEAFHECEVYTNWDFWGDVTKPIFNSANFIHVNFNKQKIGAYTLDIFNHIQTRLWTRELKGKRILIISPFIESFKEKIDIREKIYGIDLFPECTFVFLKPPQTQADCPSREFSEELNDFLGKIAIIIDDFDVALVSCGGYGNLVCSQIYKRGKSAIYVGGSLQMYFGVYGNRWERERSEIMSIYKNEYWSRPKEEERPTGFEKVERSCYW